MRGICPVTPESAVRLEWRTDGRFCPVLHYNISIIAVLTIAVLIVVFGYLLQFYISMTAIFVVVFSYLLQFYISMTAILTIAVLIVVFSYLLQFYISTIYQ